MGSRHYWLAGMAALCVAVGCQNQPEKQSQQEPQHSPDALLAQQPPGPRDPRDPAPADNHPIPDDITLLAQKAEAHAKRIAADMEKHPRPQPTGGASQPATADGPADPEIPNPSIVEWLDPQVLSLNPAPFGSASRQPQDRPNAGSTNRPAATTVIHTDPAENADPDSRGSANKPVAIAADEPIAVNTDPAIELAPIRRTPNPSAAEGAASASPLHRTLAQRIQDDPNDPVAHLEYQLLRYIEGKQVPDLGTLASLPREDQEIVTAVLDALSNFRSSIHADSNLLLSRKVKPLMDLGDRLRAQADLEIPTLVLCRRVDGFGVYEPIEHRFVAGRDRDVIVYCEVGNFMSQLTEQQQWETRLTKEVVLYTDADGLPILRDKPVIVPDLSRNRRHDFFIVRKLRLPGNIPVGRYWLKVTVVDQLASRVAEASIPITFVAN